jgi:hypothetical protein
LTLDEDTEIGVVFFCHIGNCTYISSWCNITRNRDWIRLDLIYGSQRVGNHAEHTKDAKNPNIEQLQSCHVNTNMEFSQKT